MEWKKLLGDWASDQAHGNFIAAMGREGVEAAAAAYKGYLNIRPGDQMGEKWRLKLAEQAALLVLAQPTKSARKGGSDFEWTTKTVVLAASTFIILFFFFTFVFMKFMK